ncbi:unnamed protein product [Penicillium salamii]|nr:unnamed protein product [Penicillium salamii]CAG7987043.1 unnamed protein product [Penicillium salamii]
MLLYSIIDELTRLFRATTNISFFFCQATDARINNAIAVLHGLIYSLMKKHPSLLSHVKSQIFTDILKDATLSSTYLIINTLDEYTTGLPSLLDLITQPNIKERLDTTHTAPISLELNKASISKAISKFIQHKVYYLAKVKKYNDKTLYQELNKTSRKHALKKLETFPPRLDTLYNRIIDQVRSSEDTKPYKRILAIMSIVYQPIAFNELASLIKLPDNLSHNSKTLSEVIATYGSFLTVSEKTINFIHQSARDFLLRKTQNMIFPRGIEAEHHSIFSHSLQAIFKTLQHDIFQIQFPGFPIDKVITPSPNPLAAAKYACIYWIDHLEAGTRNESYSLILNERVRVDAFLQQKYLHWLEALSVLESVSYAI